MGLCKCPKRKVTNLFCFEHRVNVCESCLVINHESCVVQSYLSWLTDSDYDPNCLFCSELLSSKETIRLKCFHVFHWACLDNRANQLPNTTAPAGYKCPICLDVIFPNKNQTSPVIEKLSEKLVNAEWARTGLSIDNIALHQTNFENHEHNVLPQALSLADSYDIHHNPPKSAHSPIIAPYVATNTINSNQKSSFLVNIDEQKNHPFDTNTFTSRSKPSIDAFVRNGGLPTRFGDTDDSADAKYTKKSFERKLRLPRLPRNFTRLLIGICILLILYIGFSYLSHFSSSKSLINEEDPMFDPHANPHIKIEPQMD